MNKTRVYYIDNKKVTINDYIEPKDECTPSLNGIKVKINKKIFISFCVNLEDILIALSKKK